MPITFNAADALEMAIQNERKAAKFYRRAARLFADRERWGFLLELADMEDRHEQVFIAMLEKLSAAEKQPTAYDPMDEAALFLEAMAAGHGGEGSSKAATALTGHESKREVLRKAIDLEGKTILFFIALRDMVPAKLGRDKIDRVIKEEKEHAALLAKQLHELKK
jgi:rubrerythrin